MGPDTGPFPLLVGEHTFPPGNSPYMWTLDIELWEWELANNSAITSSHYRKRQILYCAS
jgi:hypothetical protein